jgi:hypothetical protein
MLSINIAKVALEMNVRLQHVGRDVTGVPGMTIIRPDEPWLYVARLFPNVFEAGFSQA